MTSRLASSVGGFPLVNPVICGSGEPVMTEAGIRAALRAGAAGVIAKSVNEHPAAAAPTGSRGLCLSGRTSAPTTGPGVSLFNRSGLSQRESADWFGAIAAIDQEAGATAGSLQRVLFMPDWTGLLPIAGQARAAGLRVFELNVGAPHASEAAPGAIAQETDPDRLTELVRRVRACDRGDAVMGQADRIVVQSAGIALAASKAGQMRSA